MSATGLVAAPRAAIGLAHRRFRRRLAGGDRGEHLHQHVPAAKLLAYADHDLLVSAYLAGDFEIMSATERARSCRSESDAG